MAKRFSQTMLTLCITALVCVASVFVVLFADAHPQEVHSRSIYDVTACNEDGTIINQVLVWGISEVIVPHDPNNDHEMTVRTFVAIRNVDWVNCSEMA